LATIFDSCNFLSYEPHSVRLFHSGIQRATSRTP